MTTRNPGDAGEDRGAGAAGADAGEVVEIRLNLAFGGGGATALVRAPTRPMATSELLPILQEFDNTLVHLAESAALRQGKRVSCCAGCGACCRQLVPISEYEARRLAQVVAALPPARRAEIQRRFEEALGTFERLGLLARLGTADQIPDEPSRAELGLAYFRAGVPCPFLEQESCSIYADRPLVCREYLVTSPAEHCRNPGPDTIEKVLLPAVLSETLYRFGRHGERRPARWFPLVLALRFAAEHADEGEPRTPGGVLLERFLRQIAAT
jgi:Fe-S-cluster containining protein